MSDPGLFSMLRAVLEAFGPVSGSMLVVTLFVFYIYRQRERQFEKESAAWLEQARGDQHRLVDVLDRNARSHEVLAASITHLSEITKETATSTQRQIENMTRVVERAQS